MRWGGFQAGDPEGFGQVVAAEVHGDDRQGRPSRLPLLKQRHFHAIGLGLHRVQKHAGHLLPVNVSRFRGITAALVCGREHLVSWAAGRLVVGDAAKGRSISGQGVPDVVQAEGIHGVNPPSIRIDCGTIGLCGAILSGGGVQRRTTGVWDSTDFLFQLPDVGIGGDAFLVRSVGYPQIAQRGRGPEAESAFPAAETQVRGVALAQRHPSSVQQNTLCPLCSIPRT